MSPSTNTNALILLFMIVVKLHPSEARVHRCLLIFVDSQRRHTPATQRTGSGEYIRHYQVGCEYKVGVSKPRLRTAKQSCSETGDHIPRHEICRRRAATRCHGAAAHASSSQSHVCITSFSSTLKPVPEDAQVRFLRHSSHESVRGSKIMMWWVDHTDERSRPCSDLDQARQPDHVTIKTSPSHVDSCPLSRPLLGHPGSLMNNWGPRYPPHGSSP